MKRIGSIVVALTVVACSVVRGGDAPSAKETLDWFHGLPKLGGGVNKGLDADRFSKLTLEDLRNLKEVQIGGHPYLKNGKLGGHLKLPDSDYRYLAVLPTLETLKFPENDLGDEALGHIGKIKTLKKLQLMENQITDAGLKHLAGLTSLTHLDLRWNQKITGEGLKHLTRLPNLTHLDLRSCQKLDDSAAPHLVKIGTLEELNLFRTKVSPDVVKRIEQALPKCKVIVVQQK